MVDIVRQSDWSERYNARVLQNDFITRWHENLSGLKSVVKDEALEWQSALANGDATIANAFVGEVTGLISEIEPAGIILERLIKEAYKPIKNTSSLLD